MKRADKEKAEGRKKAFYRCTAFDCYKSRNKNQCCNYCFYVASCEKRCNNDSTKCGQLYIAQVLFKNLPKELRDLENQRKKKGR